MPSYEVKLPEFEGPLDLLLHLIEREELDITAVSLASVTSQYLEYLEVPERIEADSLADFLVIAAKLILIKSQALLPRPPESSAEGEEDAGDELVQQLLAYKRFKEIASGLGELQAAKRQTFVRVAPPPKIETRVDLSGVTVDHLVTLLRQALEIEKPAPAVDEVVKPYTLTIREQIDALEQELQREPQISFKRLLAGARSRVEIIITFLAVLELLRRRRILVRQDEMFGDIVIERKAEG